MSCCEINNLNSSLQENTKNERILDKIIVEYMFYSSDCQCFDNLPLETKISIINRCTFYDLKRYISSKKNLSIDFRFHFKEIYNIILSSVIDIDDNYLFCNKLFDIIIKSELRDEYVNYLLENKSDLLIIKCLIFEIHNNENILNLMFKTLRVIYGSIIKENNDEIVRFMDDILIFINSHFHKLWKQRSSASLGFLLNNGDNITVQIEKNMILMFNENNYYLFFEIMSRYYILPLKIFLLYDNQIKIYFPQKLSISFIFCILRNQYVFDDNIFRILNNNSNEAKLAIMKGIINIQEINEINFFFKEFST